MEKCFVCVTPSSFVNPYLVASGALYKVTIRTKNICFSIQALVQEYMKQQIFGIGECIYI